MGREDVREKLRALKQGKPLHANFLAAQRESVKKPKSEKWKRTNSERMRKLWEHPEEHNLPSNHRWTDEEVVPAGDGSRFGDCQAAGCVTQHR